VTQKILIERIYHPFWAWEETYTDMWRTAENREELLQKAIEFTGQPALYGKWMMEVIDDWPISCEHNLSNLTQNRRAWIGHAACANAFNCPEDIVREAWSHLSELQQKLANKAADRAIAAWESRYAEKKSGNECADSGTGTYSMDLR